MYPLRYIEDFSPLRKLKSNSKIYFRSREGFCLASLGLQAFADGGDAVPPLMIDRYREPILTQSGTE
jgi:hypothetical protein